MQKIEISPLKKEEISAVSELERAVFSVPFTEKSLNELYLNTSWHFFAARANGSLVGYISFYTILDETEIVNVCVNSSCRGNGIGKMLVSCAIEYSKKNGVQRLMLEVRKSNAIAIKLYESFGFIPVGVSKNHYKLPTEDAILMNLEF
ncbi:MAG: ribosomal protein S18-alanine N-acetyltransferase [Clostridia bacterium]|nr:ribosomal protein S18-alanine N-acetyltransferase [Clostridia bacterium]